MSGLLVRVGIDSTCGYWCSPVTDQGAYVYVPIPEPADYEAHRNLGRPYTEVEESISRIAASLPTHLKTLDMHLDPDFEHLTFGDQGQRASQIKPLKRDDFLAFYGAFRQYDSGDSPLMYALFGLLTVEEIVEAKNISKDRWHENAHTRRSGGERSEDIIVRGNPNRSGRFNRLVPIGDYRDGAYRVRPELLTEWGDLNVKNGYIQRSVRLPAFKDPARFKTWLEQQGVQLKHSNW